MGSRAGRGEAGSWESSAESRLNEEFIPGPIPRFEVPQWRQRFGVAAGITGRGSPQGRGFDLGLWSREPVGEVMNRWLEFRRAMTGFNAVVLGNQVHGVRVDEIQKGEGWIQLQGVDGWVTTTPGILLTVTVADCVPVYLLVPGRGAALLHAGWRGTAGGILDRGIQTLLKASKASEAEVTMHCGVGICGSCYEVGSEVMTGCGARAEGAGPWHLDLREVLVDRGRQLGVGKISSSSWCSAHDRSSFYSHRASGGTDGRMVAYLGILSRLASNPLRE